MCRASRWIREKHTGLCTPFKEPKIFGAQFSPRTTLNQKARDWFTIAWAWNFRFLNPRQANDDRVQEESEVLLSSEMLKHCARMERPLLSLIISYQIVNSQVVSRSFLIVMSCSVYRTVDRRFCVDIGCFQSKYLQ